VDAFGPVAPFDTAAGVLLVGGAIIMFTWEENYGGNAGNSATSTASEDSSDHTSQLWKAYRLIMSDRKIFLLGAMQALFEGSMYCFVFSWTPALSYGAEIPHGMIFACFMVSCMVGSALTGNLLHEGSHHRPEKYMQIVFYLASGCLFVPVLMNRLGYVSGMMADDSNSIPIGIKITLLAFCAFESLVGIFWPSMMSLRSRFVPENIRSTVINFFRIPLNLFVCTVLYNVSSLPLSAVFSMCSFFLAMCGVCMWRFQGLVDRQTTAAGVGGK
jgi:hypothetical protein